MQNTDQLVVVRINAAKILTWRAFHSYFYKTFGFPEFYGRNMHAWIDCMGDLDKADNGMSTFTVRRGQLLVLQISNIDELKKSRDIYQALLECTAHINNRRMQAGELPIIVLAF